MHLTTPTPNFLIPKLPVFGWSALRGERISTLPCVLESPSVRLTSSGQAAIVHALAMLGVGEHDVVLLPRYHPPSLLAPVLACGATMRFYPLTEEGDADLAWLQSQPEQPIKVLFAVHYFGLPRPMANLRAFCDARGIALIEDCAHALFGTYDGAPIGQLGDVAIVSLTKFLPTLEGGALCSARRELPELHLTSRGLPAQIKAYLDLIETGSTHRRLGWFNTPAHALFTLKRALREIPAPRVQTLKAPSADPLADHAFDTRLIDARPTNATTWVARHALRERLITARRRNFKILLDQLQALSGAQPLVRELPEGAAPYVFPLLVPHLTQTRHQSLRAQGLPIFRWDRLWPKMPPQENDIGMTWSQQLFQLPCHQDLDEQAMAHIVQVVRKTFEAC